MNPTQHPHLGFKQLALVVCLLAAPLLGAAASTTPPASAVASAHPLATKAGLAILKEGGNAFDAAVAVSAALAVVEPYSSGLGGGGFWLLHRQSDGLDVMIDGREMAPGEATANMYLDAQGKPRPRASLDGPLAAGIPGVPAALVHIAREYGRLPLARSLAPAIRYAEQGFPVDARFLGMAHFRLDVLRRSPAAAQVFLVNGKPPAAGHTLKQPDLARTLRALAQEGRAGFYQGETARRMVAAVRQAGGIWSEKDLSGYTVIERKPVTGAYRGIHIVSAAPPSAGGVGLVEMLNVLSGYDLTNTDRATRDHLVVEAMRRAYRDRAAYLGDPAYVDMPLERLTDPAYAAGLRAAINPARAMPSDLLAPTAPTASIGNDTTHFSILDQHGNRVAATLSVNYPFGSGFMAPGTGVVLNDEMDDFAKAPGKPNVYGLVGGRANAIAPGKRPLSSMSPTFVETRDRVGILGTPGGSRIVTMVLLGILDFAAGEPPEHWVSQPRFHNQYLPDRIQYEPGAFTDAERKKLKAMGHTLDRMHRRYGNMQAILWDKTAGKVEAASDPRGIGEAQVEKLTITETAR